MWSPRHVLVTLFLCLLAGSLLFGCRAFEPEAIIVNRLPETYIIGSPAEESGGYFHFRVYWYGTDADGYVERFVWALTDTSIQDDDTDYDEENLNFDPAGDITTLSIGTYTSRTDTTFDFQIGQGSVLSYDMTLHMVAQDDRGDFDRTPARLHFFSNALGNPQVDFYRDAIAEGNKFADLDTVAYRDPLFLKWNGSTPNTEAYDPVLLAERDTVPEPPLPPGEEPDGLLGFQWRIPGEDIPWNPRGFDEATGDSFSFFGNVTELTFFNDGSGNSIFGRVLEAGMVALYVNTIDVAGVQVPTANQALRFLVNYEPDTYILRGEVDDFHNDPKTYPYYVVFHGPAAGEYVFAEGDTVPDRAHVVFKALGWDDRRDNRVPGEDQNLLTFQTQFIAGQNIGIGGIYSEFKSTYSMLHQTPEWTGDLPTDVSSDTLRFEVGPFNYSVVMRAADEHLTRDGTPDTFKFVGNFPPCVQCIELGNARMVPTYTYGDPCDNLACLDGDVPVMQVYPSGDPRYDAGNPMHLDPLFDSESTMWVRANTGQITFERPASDEGWKIIPAVYYSYLVFLEGKEHEQEYWAPGRAEDRMAAWRYQVNYTQDSANAIRDGGGKDDIHFLTGFNVRENDPDPTVSDLYILTGSSYQEPVRGTWALRVTVGVPQFLQLIGRDFHWEILLGLYGAGAPAGDTPADTLAWQEELPTQLAFTAWKLTTMQFSPGWVEAIAADQSQCDWRSATNSYHYYNGTRIPHPNGRSCLDGAYQDEEHPEQGNIDLVDFIAYSDLDHPARRDFDLELYFTDDPDPFTPGEDPPGWILSPRAKRVSRW